MKHRALLAALAAGVLATPWLAAIGGHGAGGTDAPAPRPRLPDVSAHIPADHVLAGQIEDAADLGRRRRFDRMFDALDPGEAIEHATLRQTAQDRRRIGIDALFAVGDELFEYELRPQDGLGNALAATDTLAGPGPRPNLRRVHAGAFGGPDSFSCATCHAKGGPDGAGTNTQNAYLHGDGLRTRGADERSAPHLLGLGPVQALAAEMTRALQAQVEGARAQAAAIGAAVDITLVTKGVEFGVARAHPGGRVDTARVRGVDPDLVIRPFGWKGHQATLRGMSEESFRIHLGLVSMRVQQQARDHGVDPRVYGDGRWYDLDRDGPSVELEAGMLTTMVAYLAQLEIPVVRPPRDPRLLDAFARGSAVFDDVGCGRCHRRALLLEDPVIELRPAEARYADRPPIPIDVARDGEAPKIEPVDGRYSAYRVRLFSDLKRHDMGPALATPVVHRGVPKTVFLTRPLWGLADTAPYLHDGRAPTVHDAIRLHGGEAAAARDAYLALSEDERSALRVFLLCLTRAPKLTAP